MRPLELRLRNFRSFSGEGHDFDFRNRRLIGIVGPIGSGKSTILDAVAFALYGRTPRIGHATKSLIHQRSDHAAVSLRFEVEGEVWEAVRQLRRSGAGQHALYRMPGDEPDGEAVEKVMMERDVNRRVVELLGLDYQGFGRSVMLAQGQFQQFLAARPAERDKVLKGVFGHERVSTVRDLARSAVRTNEHEIDKLRIRIDHAEAAKARLDQRRDELTEADDRLEALEGARPMFEELDLRISRAEERCRRAEERLSDLRALSHELPDRQHGERLFDTAARARRGRVDSEHALVIATECLEEAKAAMESDEYAQGRQRLDAAGGLAAERERAGERIEARLGELSNRVGHLPDRVKGIQAVALAELAWVRREEASREWEMVAARLQEVEAVVESDEFSRRESRLDTASGLIAQLSERRESAERAAAKTFRLADALQADETSQDSARSALTRASALREAAKVESWETALGLREAEHRLQEARHADMAGTLRNELTTGDTCPVCHQPVHEVPTVVSGDVEAAQAEVERNRAKRDEAEERLRQATGAEQAAKAELTAAADRVTDSRQRIAQARREEELDRSRLDAIQGELRALLGDGDPTLRLEEERADLDAHRSTAKKARAETGAKRDALDAARREESRAQEELSDLRTRIGTLGALLDAEFKVPDGDPGAIRTALHDLHTEWRLTVSRLEAALRTEREKIEAAWARCAEAEAYLDTFRAALEQAQAARDEALGARDTAVGFDERCRRRLNELRMRVGRLGVVLETGFALPEDDPDMLRDALGTLHTGWNDTTVALERTLEEQRAEGSAAAARLAEERSRHGIEGSVEAALAEVGARRDHIVSEIEREQELVAGVVELLHERRARKRDADLNRRLVRDLTDSRFIRFLLDEERATLAGLGSEHFQRLSSGRYRFSDDGKFDIVDLNTADSVRRADSLSGGETFLASLALALGLAEMVGRRGGRLDAFFLDEGFGTLDPEHVDLAMAGVESLVAHRAQRLVVVVSHVPELRERIEDLIVLDKNPVTGDSIVAGGGAR